MPATCAGRNDLCSQRLIVDLVDQVRGDLNRKVVFLGEGAECPCHSAAASVKDRGFPTGQTFSQSFHEPRVHKRLDMAMRADRDPSRSFCDSEPDSSLPQQIV